MEKREQTEQQQLLKATMSTYIAALRVEVQLLDRLNESPWYALQLDKLTNADNKEILLVYVQYTFQTNVHEDVGAFNANCQLGQRFSSLRMTT